MRAEKARLWWALAAAITLQSFILYYQLNYGALVGLIPWDDCAIVLRALENLDKLAQAHSLWHMLGAALHLDIHAPVSDIQVIVGLLLAGGAMWGPYALNVTCLCIAIYALSTTVALKDPIVFGTSVLFLLVQPITFRALAELKSDLQGGILLATALFVLFDAAEENNDHARTLGAALLGLMLITKMTAFYLPVLALGVFLVFEFYGALKRELVAIDAPNLSQAAWKGALARLGGSARQRTMCVALIVVPYLLFFYQSHKALLAYIQGSLGSVLGADGFTMFERLLYYSPFDGKGALGRPFRALGWPAFYVLDFPRRRPNRRTLKARLAACAGMHRRFADRRSIPGASGSGTFLEPHFWRAVFGHNHGRHSDLFAHLHRQYAEVGRARRTNRRAGAGIAEHIASQSAPRSKGHAGWPGGARALSIHL